MWKNKKSKQTRVGTPFANGRHLQIVTNGHENKGQFSMCEINENTKKLKGMSVKITTVHMEIVF